MRTVFIEMEKLKNLHSGLGQFCLNLGANMVEHLPPALNMDMYVPKSALHLFGSKVSYVCHSDLHKLTGATKKPYDLWHCTHQGSPYLPPLKSTKLILTVHDLNFLQKYSGLKKRLKLHQLQQKVNRADVLTFISNYTLQVAREHLILHDKPTAVIYNGNALKIFPEAREPAYVVASKFIFTIGIISPKKNFHVLLPLIKKLKNYKLIIAGSNTSAYAHAILKQAKELGISEQVILPGAVTNEEKYWLYNNCEAFVFPSLAEGFGLPVIEAMSLGKPAFISTSTSLPEIGGPLAYYWNNFNSENMYDVFCKGMQDYHTDNLKKEAIKAWAKQFSWETAAEQYFDLYEKF